MESERKIVVKEATIIQSSNWVTVKDYKGLYTSPEEALNVVKQVDVDREQDWWPYYLRWIESTDAPAHLPLAKTREILGKERGIALVDPRGGYLVWVANIHEILPSVLFNFMSHDESDT